MQYAKFPNLYYAWIKYDIPKLYWLVLVVFTVCVCVRVFVPEEYTILRRTWCTLGARLFIRNYSHYISNLI